MHFFLITINKFILNVIFKTLKAQFFIVECDGLHVGVPDANYVGLTFKMLRCIIPVYYCRNISYALETM